MDGKGPNRLDNQMAKSCIISIIKPQSLNKYFSIFVQGTNGSILMNFNAFSERYLAWIWNYLVALGKVTSVANIQQVIIFKFTLRMAALRQEVIDVPISCYETPLFPFEAEHAAKAEFIS